MQEWGIYVILEVVFLFPFTFWLLHRYASSHVRIAYKITVFVSWLLGFMGVLLLPTDVALPVEEKQGLIIAWKIVYWSTFFIAWGVLPLMMGYYISGEITMRRRIVATIKQNIKFYLLIGALGLCFVIYMAAAKSWGFYEFRGFMMSAANIYGLILIILLLGYGIVEVPRKLWEDANPHKSLRRLEFRAPEVYAAYYERRFDVSELLADVRALQDRIPSTSTPENDELRRHVVKILQTIPNDDPLPSHFTDTAGSSSSKSTAPPTRKALAALHSKLILSWGKLMRARHRWESLVEDSIFLERVINKSPPLLDSGNFEVPTVSKWQRVRHTVEWTWNLHIGKWAKRVAAVAFALLSGLVLWCETTIPFNDQLSPIGLAVEGSGHTYGGHLLALLPLLYIAMCIYMPLFRIKLFGATVDLVAGKCTDAYSMMYNAVYLCRLQFSLAFNYIRVLQLSPANQGSTAFEAAIGSNTTNVYVDRFAPVILILFAVLTLIHAFERLLRFIGSDAITYPVAGNPEHEDRIRDGKRYLARGRRDLHLDDLLPADREEEGMRSAYRPPVDGEKPDGRPGFRYSSRYEEYKASLKRDGQPQDGRSGSGDDNNPLLSSASETARGPAPERTNSDGGFGRKALRGIKSIFSLKRKDSASRSASTTKPLGARPLSTAATQPRTSSAGRFSTPPRRGMTVEEFAAGRTPGASYTPSKLRNPSGSSSARASRWRSTDNDSPRRLTELTRDDGNESPRTVSSEGKPRGIGGKFRSLFTRENSK